MKGEAFSFDSSIRFSLLISGVKGASVVDIGTKSFEDFFSPFSFFCFFPFSPSLVYYQEMLSEFQ